MIPKLLTHGWLVLPLLLSRVWGGDLISVRIEDNEEGLERRCEPVRAGLCRTAQPLYNFTHTSNIFGHTTQEEALDELLEFTPLIESRCSPDLVFFLCSVYVPVCDPNYHDNLRACRSLCQSVQRDCRDALRLFGTVLPSQFDCSGFPDDDTSSVCMRMTRRPQLQEVHDVRKTSDRWSNGATAQPTAEDHCACPHPYVEAFVDEKKSCVLRCNVSTVLNDTKSRLRLGNAVLAVISILTSLAFLATATSLTSKSTDFDRHPYLMLAFCQIVASAGHLAAFIAGPERVICNSAGTVIHNEFDSPACILVFTLITLSGWSSQTWWCVGCSFLLLQGSMGFTHQYLSSFRVYIHVLAWTIPIIATTSVLASGKVDGDPVLGTCIVGLQDPSSLRTFMVVPLAIVITSGVSFLGSRYVLFWWRRCRSYKYKVWLIQAHGRRGRCIVGYLILCTFVHSVGLLSVLHEYVQQTRQSHTVTSACAALTTSSVLLTTTRMASTHVGGVLLIGLLTKGTWRRDGQCILLR